MKVSITRTHRLGKKLDERDRDPPVPGPIQLFRYRHPVLNRDVACLSLDSTASDGSAKQSGIPALHEPGLLTFRSSYGAMMLGGWEEIEDRRYYQGWYILFEDEG